jgi:uncharacterized protein (DUF2384 family)
MITPHTVSSVFGGQARLRARPRSARDWHELVRSGLPVAALDALEQHMTLSDAEVAQLIGVSGKTLSRARAGQDKLDPVVSERPGLSGWGAGGAGWRGAGVAGGGGALARAGPGWPGRGRSPDFDDTDAGSAEVEKLLLRIEHGVYS